MGIVALQNLINSVGASGAPNIGQLRSITAKTVDSSTQTTVTMASSSYLYDALGRVASMSQTIAGNPDTFTFTAAYYLNDALMYQTYPSGRRVGYAVDDAGRVARAAAGTRIYADMTTASPHAYHPDGRLHQMKMGNNLWETRQYRPPSPPPPPPTPDTPDTLLMLGASAGTGERVALGYDYHPTANNGNLQSHLIRYDGGAFDETQEFRYDPLNRIEFVGEYNGAYHRSFAYDAYGNRWVVQSHEILFGTHEPRASTVFDTATNRMTTSTVAYDAAGNQTIYTPYRLVYDAENRLVSMTSPTSGNAAYAYDAMGRRVRKTWTPGGGTAENTYYVYDIAGNLAAEYGTGTAPASGTVYPFVDLLGSVRMVTDAAGAVVECYDYLPFGRMLRVADNGRSTLNCHPPEPDTAIGGSTSQKFTGQVRDAESRLDYFGARYMSAPQGRFLSPDPLMASAKANDPQSWNRYTYTLNNPLRYVDPDGLDVPEECVEDEECPIVVSVNVIYDSDANNGQGFTAEQKNEFEQGQLAEAQKAYGTSNITLKVAYTEGTASVRNGSAYIDAGSDANAVNIFVSRSLPSNYAGMSGVSEIGDVAAAFVNYDKASTGSFITINTTAHELGHHFIGDVYRPKRGGVPGHFQYVARDIAVDNRLRLQALGFNHQPFREGLTDRVYAVPLNPEANEPRQ